MFSYLQVIISRQFITILFFSCLFFVRCVVCLSQPSRSSFLTGMRPDSTGVYDLASSFRDRLGPAAVTLPGYFKALGYATVGVGKVFHGELDDPEAWTEPWQPCNRPHYPPGRSWPHATRGTVEIGGLAAAAAAAAAATETRPTRASAATGHRSRAHGLTGLNASFTVKHTVSELLGAGGGAEPAMGSVEACHDDLDLVGCDAFRDHAIASAAVASLRKLAANAPKKLGRTPQATLEGGGWDETRRPPSMSRSSSSSSSGSGSPSSSIGSGSPSSSGERNFFLAVGFTKPHLPFVFPSKYWRLYDKGEQQTPVPLAPQPRRQKGAPPWAVELGAELFSFSDTAPLKKRAKQRLVTHNAAAAAAAAGRSGGGAGGHRRGSGGVTADRNKEASQVSDVVDFDDVDDVGGLDRSEGGRTLSASLERHLRKGYFAATSFVDAQVGRVVAEADRLHLLETNTVVCLLGDHGWKLGDHGGWSKLSNVEQDTRVPLIVTLPRALASQHLAPAATRSLVQTSNALVELVDLFPSLAHLATGHDPSTMTMAVGGVKLQRLEGNSFANVLLERPTLAPAVPSSLSSLPGRDHHGRHRRSVKVADEEKVVWKRAVFSQVPRSFGGGGVVGRRRKKKLAMMGYSMRTQRFRLTLWVDCGSALSVDVSQRPMRISLDPSFHVTNQRVRSQVVATELYDLRLDPHEGDNKFQNASYAGALQGLLSDWRAGWEGARGALPLPLDQRVL